MSSEGHGSSPNPSHGETTDPVTQEVLAGAGNVETPAYLVLRRLGFDVTYDQDNDGRETWSAVKPDLKLIGESPLQVLGLYCLRQQRGENWKASDEEIKEFLSRFHYE